MNDLFKKRETILKNLLEGGMVSDKDGEDTAMELFYGKLEAYLLLLYQSYLKGETVLEPKIRMALWRMVQFKEEFRAKIQLTQLNILARGQNKIGTNWDDSKDNLFPVDELKARKPPTAEQERHIEEYKEIVLGLLQMEEG